MSSKPATIRFVVACKECAVCDDTTLTYDEAAEDGPMNDDPAHRHYERTGHTCLLVNYTQAPYDVQQMLDDGRLEALDFERLAEYVTGNDEQADSLGNGGQE